MPIIYLHVTEDGCINIGGFLADNNTFLTLQTICNRILENHPYGRILHIKYLVLKSSFKIWFFVHLVFQYSKNALNYKEKYRNI